MDTEIRFICDSVCYGAKTLIIRCLALLEYIILTQKLNSVFQRVLIIWNIIFSRTFLPILTYTVVFHCIYYIGLYAFQNVFFPAICDNR